MKDIIRMNQLAGTITEGQAKKMSKVLTEEMDAFGYSNSVQSWIVFVINIIGFFLLQF